jgi:hypothetical protein
MFPSCFSSCWVGILMEYREGMLVIRLPELVIGDSKSDHMTDHGGRVTSECLVVALTMSIQLSPGHSNPSCSRSTIGQLHLRHNYLHCKTLSQARIITIFLKCLYVYCPPFLAVQLIAHFLPSLMWNAVSAKPPTVEWTIPILLIL